MSVRYRISETVRATGGNDGGVILDIGQGRVFALNRTGSLIFARLGRGETEAQVVSRLSHELGAARETLARDLREFLDRLMQQKLITVTSSAGSRAPFSPEAG